MNELMTDRINEVKEWFHQNLERVDNLVSVYQEVVRDETSGRPPVADQDVLRSAIVFLHASLEELLRTTLRWKLPDADAKTFRKIGIPLHGDDKDRAEFNLSHLVRFRGQSVDELLQEQVDEYLEESNFNHPGEVKNHLEYIGIDPGLVDPYADAMGPLMKRRHHIVHQVDVNRSQGSGHHTARSVNSQTVTTWRQEIENFGADFLEALEEQL